MSDTHEKIKKALASMKTTVDVKDKTSMVRHCYRLGEMGAAFGVINTPSKEILKTTFAMSIVSEPTEGQQLWLDAWEPNTSELLAFELGYLHGMSLSEVGRPGKQRCEQRLEALVSQDINQIDLLATNMMLRLETAAILGFHVPEYLLRRIETTLLGEEPEGL